MGSTNVVQDLAVTHPEGPHDAGGRPAMSANQPVTAV